MLNDYSIDRDVISFVRKYVESQSGDLTKYRRKLQDLSQKQQVSYAQWWALLDELNTLVDEPALGLAIGGDVKAEDCGVIGYLFKTSRNMAEALNCYSRFERLLYAGSQVETITTNNEQVSLAWDPENGYSTLLSDALLLTGIVSVARDILKPREFSPVAVHFTHPIPDAEVRLYEAFFGCKIAHSQTQLSITFHLEDLLSPIPHQDNVLHTLLGKQAEEQLKKLPENDLFMMSLHDTIVRCLHEGRPDAEAIATELHISVRTLHRRLKTKNRVYRDVLRDIRKSMAERYLRDDKLTLSEVALLLGYQDQSAFTRAFSQWFSLSPKQYKTQSECNR